MTAVVAVRCDPFGHGTDRGPRHLMGGLFGTAYEGPYKWACPNPSDGRFVMTCPYGHIGEPRHLCYPHVAQIGKRMAGVCTRCALPPEAVRLWEDQQRYSGMLVRARDAGDRAELARIMSKLDDLGKLSIEQVERGVVRKVQMTLREISLWPRRRLMSASGPRPRASPSVPMAGCRRISATGTTPSTP